MISNAESSHALPYNDCHKPENTQMGSFVKTKFKQ